MSAAGKAVVLFNIAWAGLYGVLAVMLAEPGLLVVSGCAGLIAIGVGMIEIADAARRS